MYLTFFVCVCTFVQTNNITQKMLIMEHAIENFNSKQEFCGNPSTFITVVACMDIYIYILIENSYL